VDVQLVPTQGSIDNLAMLHDQHSGVGIALIQGGTVAADQKSGLESLGTLFYEPMWWFHRRDIQGEGIPSLLGRKISIGPEGSGTRALALSLLKAGGIEQRVELLPLTPREAADKLLAGEIDVAFMMASWEAPVGNKREQKENIPWTNLTSPPDKSDYRGAPQQPTFNAAPCRECNSRYQRASRVCPPPRPSCKRAR
jgi:TRAP-type uncharacterized transport system substrate-binding protein